MSYDENAPPLISPGESGSARGEETVLTTADWSQFSAFAVHPSYPTETPVLVYPDVRGLH